MLTKTCNFCQNFITEINGYSLTEVLITLAFITAVLTPLFNLLQAVYKTDYESERRLTAVRSAQEIVEQLIITPFEKLIVGDYDLSEDAALPFTLNFGKDDDSKTTDKNIWKLEKAVKIENVSPVDAGIPKEMCAEYAILYSDFKMITAIVSWRSSDSTMDSVNVSVLKFNPINNDDDDDDDD